MFIPTADSPLVAKQVERVVSVDLDSFWPKETNEETNDEPFKPDRPVVEDLLAINDGDGPPIATPNGPAWRALSDAVERGVLPPELLFSAWVEGSARGSDQTVPTLERELVAWFDAARADPLAGSAAERLGRLKQALFEARDLVYERDASSLADVVAHGRVQCHSGSVVVALTALRDGFDSEEDGRLVFVHTPGHVQPAWLTATALHVVEATTRDAWAERVALTAFQGGRVIEAKRALAIAALGDAAPDWLWDDLVLVEAEAPGAEDEAFGGRGPILPAGLTGPRPSPGERPLSARTQPGAQRPASRVVALLEMVHPPQGVATAHTTALEPASCHVNGLPLASERERVCEWLGRCTPRWREATFRPTSRGLELAKVDGLGGGAVGSVCLPERILTIAPMDITPGTRVVARRVSLLDWALRQPG